MVTYLLRTNQHELFSTKLTERAQHKQTWLCVGLDPDAGRLPHHLPATATGVVDFCRRIVEATADAAAAFKINFAFFEALGVAGWEALYRVRQSVPPEILVIADAKREDIGNTSSNYATGILKELGFDAVTVSPYMGADSLQPFLDVADRAVFVLCRTSNPGAAEYQDLQVDGEPLYLRVARSALAAPATAEVGLVVGATQPDALRRVRALGDATLLLVPGAGPQGATVEDALRNGANEYGRNALINVSRDILYADSGPDFATAARAAAIARARQTVRLSRSSIDSG